VVAGGFCDCSEVHFVFKVTLCLIQPEFGKADIPLLESILLLNFLMIQKAFKKSDFLSIYSLS
jgi:hypothetical protein